MLTQAAPKGAQEKAHLSVGSLFASLAIGGLRLTWLSSGLTLFLAGSVLVLLLLLLGLLALLVGLLVRPMASYLRSKPPVFGFSAGESLKTTMNSSRKSSATFGSAGLDAIVVAVVMDIAISLRQ